jgi:Ca-activated chloride channel homolog
MPFISASRPRPQKKESSTNKDLFFNGQEKRRKAMKLKSLIVCWISTFTLLIVGIITTAHAGVIVPKASGGKKLPPLQVVRQQVKVEIDNQVARTKVTQVFVNNTGKKIEGVYYFPLPENAGVEGFATWVNGEKIIGKVEEKGEAKKTYKEARRAGEDAALLTYVGGNKFQTKVASIPPGGNRKIEILYSEILPYDSGRVEYRYPLDHKGLKTTPIKNISINIRIKDQKEIILPKSTTHPGASIKKGGAKKASVSWSGSGYKPDKDFVIYYKVKSSDFGVNFLTHRKKGEDGYFLLMVAPQEDTTAKDIVNKDIVFVFDKSGSMSGTKISQARSAMKKCLSFMNPGDYFNIIAFDSNYNPMMNKTAPLNTKNLNSANQFIDNISAGGGTDLTTALVFGLKQLKGSPRPKVIIFLTDGRGSNPLQSVKDANPMGARIFVFGVGNGVNRNLLDELALDNRGSADYVKEGESIDKRVADFYSRISKPVLTDMDMKTDNIVAVNKYPKVMPDVYKGSRLVIVGRYRGDGKDKLTLTGNINGIKKTFSINHDWPSQEEDNSFVSRLWAKKRVDYLLTDIRLFGEKKEYKDEVIALSKQYMFITPYTSFVARAEKPIEVAKLIPSRIKPGDPEVYINAPEDAKGVTVIFPFGLTKKCVYMDDFGLWMTRFLISTDTPDGVYDVLVIITMNDGAQKRLTLNYTVDRKAPVMELNVAATARPGELLTVHARPIVSFHELLEAVSLRDMGVMAETVKSKIDVKSAVITLDGKYACDLELVNGRIGWMGEVEIPTDITSGDHELSVITVDWAGNRHTDTEVIWVDAPMDLASE